MSIDERFSRLQSLPSVGVRDSFKMRLWLGELFTSHYRVAPYGKKPLPLPYRNFNYLRSRGMLEMHFTAITCNFYY